MAQRRITQTTPHDSPGTLVFDAKDLCEIRPESPPTGALNAGWVGQNLCEIRPESPPTGALNVGWVGQNRRLSKNNRLYLENGTR